MPLMRRMAESESATAPLPTTLPSNPAPSTTATSCFCRHANTSYIVLMVHARADAVPLIE